MTGNEVSMRAEYLFLVILVLWAGLLLGVSFLATPVKFAAPHLTMPVALEIGVATYRIFTPVEWGLLAVAFVVAAAGIKRFYAFALLAVLAVLMFMQSLWLLPVLHLRAASVIAGEAASPGMHHWLYIIMDVAKLAVMLAGAGMLRWSRIWNLTA